MKQVKYDINDPAKVLFLWVENDAKLTFDNYFNLNFFISIHFYFIFFTLSNKSLEDKNKIKIKVEKMWITKNTNFSLKLFLHSTEHTPKDRMQSSAQQSEFSKLTHNVKNYFLSYISNYYLLYYIKHSLSLNFISFSPSIFVFHFSRFIQIIKTKNKVKAKLYIELSD